MPKKYEPNWDACRPSVPDSQASLQKAAAVLAYGIDSIVSFHDLFEKSRTDRGAAGGYTTHAEQDLLRSMIVFAAATLDSVIKQLIRDCLESVAKKNLEAKSEFEKFVDRRLRSTEGEASVNIPLLRSALLSGQPPAFLAEEYVRDLTGGSLQSKDEVVRAASALGIDLQLKKPDHQQIQEVFDARNQIIHELDYLHRKQKQKQRNRRNRNRKLCLEQTERLLLLARTFVDRVASAV